MPRPHRENLDGGIYHVYARGNAQGVIYRDDADHHIHLRLLRKAATDHAWWCLAYCLMPNHLHLLVETPMANLSAGMQRLQSRYAQEFNLRHGRTGHLFQGRYGAVRITTAEQLRTTAAYIARNPCEAGLCSRPQDWEWSSHRGVMDGTAPSFVSAARLLAHFGAEADAARTRYADMTEGGPATKLKRV